MRKTFLILLCLIAALSVFISCSSESEMDVTNVRFYISEERSRTLGADLAKASVTQYKFTLANKNNNQFNYNLTFAKNESGSYMLPGIVPGSYDITVDGLNANGEILTQYTAVENISKNKSTFDVSLTSLYGKGNMSVSFKWTPSSIVDQTGAAITPDVTITLKDQAGTKIEGVTVDKSKIAQGEIVISKSDLPSGSYFLNLSVNKNSVYYYGYTEVVRISNTDVSATVDFSELATGNVNTSAELTDTTSAPIVANLTVSEVNGVTMLALDYTNFPVGKTSNDIVLKFYVDDYEMTTSKNAEGKYPLPGFYGSGRITVVMNIPSVVGSMGSVSKDYNKP